MTVTVRAISGVPVLRSSMPAGNVSGGGKRRGNAAFSTLIESAMPYRYAEQDRFLSNDELWTVYTRVPDVRAAIDAVALRIATWNWEVKPTLDPSDPEYEQALELAQQCKDFLSAPNTDNETWQDWLSKFARDLLVFDAGAVEHVLDGKGNLTELVVLRGGDITPIVDVHQRLVFYKQINRVAQQVDLEPEQLTYMNLFPNTTAPGGKPLIESLIHEVITLMQQAKHLMRAYDADEVPPGILTISGISGKAAEKTILSLQNMRGHDEKLRVLTFENPQAQGAEWIEFRKSPKDLDMKDLVREVRRIVWRIFHVKPVTMGDSEATPRATAEVQLEAEEEGLIVPILELFEAKLNSQIMPMLVGDAELSKRVRFSFEWNKKQTSKEKKEEAESDSTDLKNGVISINERRKRIGMDPIEGGDTHRALDTQGWTPVAKLPTDQSPAPVVPTTPKARSKWRRLEILRGNAYEPEVQIRGGKVPDDWKRATTGTVDLSALGTAIYQYHRRVSPAWRMAHREVIRAFRHAALGGTAPDLQTEIPALFRALSEEWARSTEDVYRQAARLGREAAIELTGDRDAAAKWEEQAAVYHRAAMGWLDAEKGLLRSMEAELLALVPMALKTREDNNGIVETAGIRGERTTFDLLYQVRQVFRAHEYRVAHWSGKLSELAHRVCGEALGKEWTARWKMPEDGLESPDCERHHNQQWEVGKAPLPTGQVRNSGRCRCHLEYAR